MKGSSKDFLNERIIEFPTQALIMGMWLATSFVGDFLAGWIGSYWSRVQKPEFFLIVTAIAALAGTMIWACRCPLHGALRE